MPELPDIVVYIEALEKRIVGQKLERVRLGNPFLVRTADPPLSAVEGRDVVELRRIGKRIAIGLGGDGNAVASDSSTDIQPFAYSQLRTPLSFPRRGVGGEVWTPLWLVLHLMIAGRLHWRDANARSEGAKARLANARAAGKISLAAFDFANGTLVLTEAGTKRRASLHVIAGEAGLDALNPGGLEVLDTDLGTFTSVLTASNHTLKRALTDPRLFSGIGNAYSDEILFEAGLSPILLTQKMTEEQTARLFEAIRTTLTLWVDRLRADAGDGFPEKVTAFRKDMAVHGRYEQPCIRCGTPIQRIRYADNETNYCTVCQTGGKLLADRALSRLLGKDWPKSLDEMELLTARHGR